MPASSARRSCRIPSLHIEAFDLIRVLAAKKLDGQSFGHFSLRFLWTD